MRLIATAFVALPLALAACRSAQIGSVGAVLGRDGETQAVYIRDVPSGLAADRAGLLPGDEILMIDGVYVRALTSKDLRARLRGDPGSTVELTVARGSDVRRLRVIRSELREGRKAAPREERIDP
ncbi:PDZ domain-containing protein [Chondromyces crocatus]|uniref:PDZ domain-containing protein n=1 Tax=Chondromyces crocatus TaxID=52 RepID=UPI001FE21542|nr:PDZ domain-containing protein [Chondromyces crocatus]